MEWTRRLIRLLNEAFQIEHMTASGGRSYGAGQPISAVRLLESAIPGEEMEYYPEILIDEWAAGHLIDQELGLDTLVEFEFVDDSGGSQLVQFSLLQTDDGRAFLGRKIEGWSLEFLLAIDPEALEALTSASLLALLASDEAFGEPIAEVRLPSAILNRRPDVIGGEVLRSGIRLMLDQVEGRGIRSWSLVAERCGRPEKTDHELLIQDYFETSYDETEQF